MSTLTIELNQPSAKKLIDELVAKGLISIVKSGEIWTEKWQKLSDQLSDTTDISEQDILNEIDDYRSKN